MGQLQLPRGIPVRAFPSVILGNGRRGRGRRCGGGHATCGGRTVSAGLRCRAGWRGGERWGEGGIGRGRRGQASSLSRISPALPNPSNLPVIFGGTRKAFF